MTQHSSLRSPANVCWRNRELGGAAPARGAPSVGEPDLRVCVVGVLPGAAVPAIALFQLATKALHGGKETTIAP